MLWPHLDGTQSAYGYRTRMKASIVTTVASKTLYTWSHYIFQTNSGRDNSTSAYPRMPMLSQHLFIGRIYYLRFIGQCFHLIHLCHEGIFIFGPF